MGAWFNALAGPRVNCPSHVCTWLEALGIRAQPLKNVNGDPQLRAPGSAAAGSVIFHAVSGGVDGWTGVDGWRRAESRGEGVCDEERT